MYGIASAGLAHHEAAQGDLPGNRDAPTPAILALADNDVIGSTWLVNGHGVDQDYLTVTIGPGQANPPLKSQSQSQAPGRATLGARPCSARPGALVAYLLVKPNQAVEIPWCIRPARHSRI